MATPVLCRYGERQMRAQEAAGVQFVAMSGIMLLYMAW